MKSESFASTSMLHQRRIRFQKGGNFGSLPERLGLESTSFLFQKEFRKEVVRTSWALFPRSRNIFCFVCCFFCFSCNPFFLDSNMFNGSTKFVFMTLSLFFRKNSLVLYQVCALSFLLLRVGILSESLLNAIALGSPSRCLASRFFKFQTTRRKTC